MDAAVCGEKKKSNPSEINQHGIIYARSIFAVAPKVVQKPKWPAQFWNDLGNVLGWFSVSSWMSSDDGSFQPIGVGSTMIMRLISFPIGG